MGKRMSQGEHARLLPVGEKGEGAVESIDDEKLARRRSRAHIPFYPRSFHFNQQASKDGIRHFVDGIGDLNPLFRNEEYARKTKYGNILAPGSYLYSVCWTLRGSGITGAHGWFSGANWEWYRPIFAGDEFKVVGIIRDLVEKKGRMAGGKSIYLDYSDAIYVNQRGEIVAKQEMRTVRTGRTEAGSAKKERNLPAPTYSHEDWIRILDAYDNEELRGAEPRWWEDVQVGDGLGPMIKGPLSIRDEIAWLMGGGSPFIKAHKIEMLYESRHPKALEFVQETGERDVPELVHVFDAFARGIGVERAYDYGSQRICWYAQLFTNWMGDDGFLWKMNTDLRAFNQVGDITTFEGKVTRKYIEDGKCCVDIEASGKNQRGVFTMPAQTSTVILPSKELGPVVYPNPSPKLMQEVERAKPLDELIQKGLI